MKSGLGVAIVTLSLFNASPSFAQATNWGLLANPGNDSHGVPWDGQVVKSTYFFPGEGKVDQVETLNQNTGCASSINFGAVCNMHAYGPTLLSNAQYFSFLPDDARELTWSSGGSASQDYVLGQMMGAHVNVVTMSYWVDQPGHTGDWMGGTPVQDATCPDGVYGTPGNPVCPADELFDAAVRNNVLVLPAIDGITIQNQVTGQGWSTNDPLVQAIELLLRRFIISPPPGHTGWPYQWALIHDKAGAARPAFLLVNAGSNYPLSAAQFIAALDGLRDQVKTDTGWQIGFTVDPTPDIHPVDPYPLNYGYGPDTNTPFETMDSLLAIQELFQVRRNLEMSTPFYDNNSGYCGTTSVANTFSNAVTFKQQWIQGFLNRNIPVYLDVMPGYDGRYTFTSSGVLGDNTAYYSDDWRNAESQLTGLGAGLKGYFFTTWNGWGEGWIAVPSKRIQSTQRACGSGNVVQCLVGSTQGADDVQLRWMTDVFANDPRSCTVNYYEQYGAVKYLVYGDICNKWRTSGGSLGFGPPDTNQIQTLGYGTSTYCSSHRTSQGVFACIGPGVNSQGYGGNGTGGQVNRFAGDTKAIYWGAPGSHTVYGAIYQEYLRQSQDYGFLGLPVSDEEGSGACNGRTNQFQGGWIDYCYTARSWPYQGCPYGNICAHH